MMIHMEYYLVVSTIMMFAGIYGFFTRRNTLAILISVELMLNATDINFAVFNRFLFPDGLEGYFFALFSIAISAAETAVAIAIMINIYRNIRSIQVKKLDDMNEEINKREGKETSSEAGIADPYEKQQLAANTQSAQLTATEAENELEKARAGVTAEFPGIVTKIATVSTSKDATKGGGLLEGATVAEGTELFTIESNKQVKVGIEVTKYDLPKIAIGQQVDVTIAGNVYEGEVSKINKVAAANSQGTPVVGAEVHIKNPDDSIFLGVEAKLVIHTAYAENVITIPVEIVNADKQGEFCYVVDNGVVTMRRITTGISSDSMVEVKEGLKEGDQIVYDVTGTIMEGMKVMAVPMGGGMAGQTMMETGAAAGETEAVTETASEAVSQTAAGEGSSEEAGGETETAESQAASGTLGSENE